MSLMILPMLAAALGALIIISISRVISGTTIQDRVIAADVANTIVVALMVVLGATFREIIYIDVAIIYALLSFISTLYISKYLEEHS